MFFLHKTVNPFCGWIKFSLSWEEGRGEVERFLLLNSYV